MQNIANLVSQLQLEPHPEGGFYRETYRSREKGYLESFGGVRNHSTAIYFLLPAGGFSAFHKIKSDELWHFYEGLPLHVYVILPDGKLQILKLGRNASNGESYQAVVPAGCWFASRPVSSDSYSLVGCTVAPGFDFEDFTMAERKDLQEQFPQYRQLIEELTRD